LRESKGAQSRRKKDVPGSTPAKKRGQRTSDIGRALRSVYDETLREDIPDDFMHLLGKLS
jgi:hypothetical protein